MLFSDGVMNSEEEKALEPGFEAMLGFLKTKKEERGFLQRIKRERKTY